MLGGGDTKSQALNAALNEGMHLLISDKVHLVQTKIGGSTMKIYDVFVDQVHIDKKETRIKNYQVVGCDLYQAVFCAGQRFHDNTDWVTEKLKVGSLDGKEFYETVFEGGE